MRKRIESNRNRQNEISTESAICTALADKHVTEVLGPTQQLQQQQPCNITGVTGSASDKRRGFSVITGYALFVSAGLAPQYNTLNRDSLPDS